MCGDFLGVGHPYNTSGVYKYNRTGKNVDIYIADTGIFEGHDDFKDKKGNSRVITIYPDKDKMSSSAKNGDYYKDTHGTSVASCAAGNICGVAKEANIFNVWVLHSGSGVIKGIDRVLEHHLNKNNCNPSILNMSFGTRSTTYLFHETKDLIENGVICLACAHNYSEPISTAPAVIPHVISVGSASWDNKMASHSNYGDTVDILAPGEHVKVARVDPDNRTKTNHYINYGSGTSYATPYTAGVLALIIQDSCIENEDDINKAKQLLYEYSRKNFIQVKGSTPNRLIFSLVENEPIKPRKYKVTVVQNSNTETFCIEKGDTLTISLDIPDGYKLDTIEGDNPGGQHKNSKYYTNSITSNATYIFKYKKMNKPDKPEKPDKKDDSNSKLPIIIIGLVTSALALFATYKI
ncbi:MAG: S8 family serine peptidase [bacterium]